MTKLVYLLTLLYLSPVRLLAQDVSMNESKIVLEVPSAPWGWFVAAFLLVAVVALLGVVLAMTKKTTGLWHCCAGCGSPCWSARDLGRQPM